MLRWICAVSTALVVASAAGCSDDATPDASGADAAGAAGTGAGGSGAAGGEAAGASGPGGSGGAGEAGCQPLPGDAQIEAYCDEVQLAVMRKGAATTLRVYGRLESALGQGACMRLDSVDLVRSDETVAQTLDANGAALSSGDTVLWASADAAGEVAGVCDDEAARVEPYGMIVRGTIDGGTFEARCGKTELGSSWPPRVVLTCHEGIDTPGTWTTPFVAVNGPNVSATLYTSFAIPPTITDVAPAMRVVPFRWMGSPLLPFDTSGWDATAQAPQNGSVSVDFWQQDDPFGEEVCPPVVRMPEPGDEPPPIFLARITGQSDQGAFSSEIYARGCQRVIMQ